MGVMLNGKDYVGLTGVFKFLDRIQKIFPTGFSSNLDTFQRAVMLVLYFGK